MIFLALASVAMIVLILVDAFETTVLPRRVTHSYRLAVFFYRNSWTFWRLLAAWLPAGKSREAFLGLYGPLSLLGLLAVWVVGLIFAYGILFWSVGIDLHAPEEGPTFWTYLYMSGVTFFTLGYGDVVPLTTAGRTLVVVEAGMGFGFLAVIIGYVPVMYQVFSRREALIGVLDARAGSPPSAAQLLFRLAQSGNIQGIDTFLAECERWSAELLESQLSFPVLALYRSQHDNQSWVAALTAILDTCAFLIVGVKGYRPYQAQLTFAMARHAAVDLALILRTPPVAPESDRLPATQLRQLRDTLRELGVEAQDSPAVDRKLAELRGMYEPFVNALARRCLFTLPPFMPDRNTADNWQRSAWMRRAPEFGRLPIASTGDGHFE